MKNTRAISRIVIAGIIVVIIVVAGVVGYYLTMPTTPATKDTLVMGTTDTVETSLDPANAYDYFGWEIIRSIGAGLIDYAPGATGPSDIIPDLATNWTVSTDGLQYTFTLRQGVKYDDNITEFNATDVKYTFDRDIGMQDPNGAFVGLGFAAIVQNVTVVDTYTVRFYLKSQFPFFIALLAGEECVMIDPKYAPMHGTSWNAAADVVLYKDGDPRASSPAALGPYVLANWTRPGGVDTGITLVANPNYWNASGGYPKTKNFIIQFYKSSSTLALAIKNAEVDIAFRQLGVSDINDMKNSTSLQVWQGTGSFIQYLCLQERLNLFNETNIRRAIGAAINRTMLVNTVFQGQGQNLYTMIPIGMFGHKDVFQNLGDPDYNLTQTLLAPYGFNATHKFTFTLNYETSGHYPQSQQVAQVLQASLEDSGVITVNLNSLEWAAMGSARRAGTMEAFVYGWYPDYIDPDDYIQPFLQTSGASWLNLNYSDPMMDQLIDWARFNTTAAVRNTLYGQIQDLMVTDAPIIPLYQGSQYAITSLKVKGIVLDITQNWRPWLVYAEK